MKRSKTPLAVLTFCVVMPFVIFGDDFAPSKLLIRRWASFGVESGVVNSVDAPIFNVSSEDDVFSVLNSSTFGVCINSLRRNYNLGVVVPSFSTNVVFGSGYGLMSITNSVRGRIDGSVCFSSIARFPRVQSLFQSTAALYWNGYRGSGFSDIFVDGDEICVNVNFPLLYADVLSSTNTVFRQILLSHISAISSNLQNIDVNVSGLQSTIQQGNDDIIDALIGDYPEIQEELRKGNSRAADVRTSIKSQLQAWRTQATQQLNDWKSDLKSDLQAWKTSDETGYLNVRQGLSNVSADIDSLKHQFMTDDGHGNAINYTTFTTNFVTIPITNSVVQSGADISSNVQDSAKQVVDRINELWDSFYDIAGAWDGDGLAVRIVHPTDGDNHVLVRDDAVLRALEEGVTFVSPELTHISDYWDQFMASFSPTNSIDWEPWFEKWVPFSEVVTNYYAEFNESVPASEIAADFLDRGFDAERYSALPWFERVEVLLAMIADVRSNSVDVADIEQDMERQVSDFQTLSTNIVSVSGDVVGLFGYVQRFSSSLQSMFGDRAAPLSGDYVLLSAGHWIGDEPLVLRINPTIQNLCRLIMQCIWYLGFLVLLWVVVNWCWQKVVAVLRWLWSMFDV